MKQIPKPRHERLPALIPQNAVVIKLWNLHVFTMIILKNMYIYIVWAFTILASNETPFRQMFKR